MSEVDPSLDALRSQGAQRLDPMRFHYLEALSRRLHGAPADVRGILQAKLDEALRDYAERFQQTPHAANDEVVPQRTSPRAAQAACLPLAQLNRHIQQVTQQALGPTEPSGMPARRPSGETPDRAEMKSLRGFRETWAKIAAEDQLDKAVGRAPQNAGPLNSHLLVLRSLALMRDLSPDYLRRFLSHLDALLWLDQANGPFAVAGLKSAKRASRKDKPST